MTSAALLFAPFVSRPSRGSSLAGALVQLGMEVVEFGEVAFSGVHCRGYSRACALVLLAPIDSSWLQR
ncbi:MAG: hypothetical protein WBP81_02620 [Solirubrobacteraceae bacterium]